LPAGGLLAQPLSHRVNNGDVRPSGLTSDSSHSQLPPTASAGSADVLQVSLDQVCLDQDALISTKPCLTQL